MRLRFAVNSRLLVVLFPTNKMPPVTKIVIEKHCDSYTKKPYLTVSSPLNRRL